MTRLKTILSYAWIAGLVLFVAYYGFEKWDVLKSVFAALDIELLIEVLLLMLLGKLALVYIMQKSCERFSLQFSFADCFYIYNVTQMAKYLPGSVWQFVGRFVMLKDRGADNRQIRDAILSEHLWVVTSAGVLGVILASYRYDVLLPALVRAVGSADPAWKIGLAVATGLIALGAAAAMYAWTGLGRLWAWSRSMLPSPRVLVALALGWVAFGLSFWVTTPPFTETPPPWLYAVGIYCLGYTAGFMVPFAPAGLGIREAVIALGMTPYLGLDYSVLLASLNRGMYFLAELSVFSLAVLLRSRKISHVA